MPVRRAFSLIEILVAGSLLVAISGTAFLLLRESGLPDPGMATHVSLQSATRVALVRFIKELQESVEFVRPVQGTTLAYCVARDKVNQIVVIYMVPNEGDSRAAGRSLHDLHLYRYDYDLDAPERNQVRILSRVERAAFTALSPGLVQIDIQLHEAGRSYTLLTTIRARNILGEGILDG